MKLKTILITGASGVIGRLLSFQIINEFKIIAIGKDYSRIPEEIRHHKNFKFYERDFLKIKTPKDLSISEPVDIILHLAGAVSGSKLNESDFFQINAESTKILLEFAEKIHCLGIGLASSVSVYGYQNQKLQLESERAGKTVYARSKIEAENYLKKSHIPYSIFRIASVYGTGTKSFVSKLFSLYKKGFYPYLKNDPKKSIIHVEDVAYALATWCRKVIAKEKIRTVYVLSHPESVTISQVIGTFHTQRKRRFKGLGIPIFPVLVPIFNKLAKIKCKLKGIPYHDSPLTPILQAVEIYDENSWKELAIEPKWDLRKGIFPYK
ncbi:MAG: NAD(P)-dependent oxidoreductase [Leptospira sp.]|nr:NAD(P)-dependent oxidoreductase [Leptospira sp.]